MSVVSAFVSGLVSLIWTLFLVGAAAVLGIRVARDLSVDELPILESLPDFLSIPLHNQSENMIISTLAGVLAGFLFLFLAAYVWQALLDALRLGMVHASLKRAGRKGRFQDPDGSIIEWRWLYYPLASRLWREYAETLHRQPVPGALGGAQVRYRSTLPAETVFSQQVLVDVPMRVEFFRHLPGILTGAGIVSTFAGILMGLSDFNPAVPVDQVTLQLKNLFTGVTTAFLASFFAIATAIAVTVIEKLILHWRYAQVSAFQCRMDDLFRAGVEPEYLADLVAGGASGFERLESEMGRVTASLDGYMRASGGRGAGEKVVLDAIKPVLERFGEELAAQRTATVRELREALAVPLAALTQAVNRMEDRSAATDAAADGTLETELARIGGKLDDTLDVMNHQSRLLEQLVVAGERAAADSDTPELARQRRERELHVLKRLGETLESLPSRLPSREDVERMLKSAQETQTAVMNRLGDSISDLPKRLPSGEEIAARLSSQLDQTAQGLTSRIAGLEEGLAEERRAMESVLGQAAGEMSGAGQAWGARLVAELERAMSEAATRQGEMMAALNTLAGRTEAELARLRERINAADGDLAEANRELSETIIASLSERLETTVGNVAEGLTALRERFADQRESLDEAMQGWLEKAGQGTQVEPGEIDREVQEVVLHVDNRHAEMIEVIDRMNRQLSQDLQQMRQGLQENNEQVGSQVTRQMQELGESLEGVVTGIGREQSVFIEMLGERVNALRKRLKVK